MILCLYLIMRAQALRGRAVGCRISTLSLLLAIAILPLKRFISSLWLADIFTKHLVLSDFKFSCKSDWWNIIMVLICGSLSTSTVERIFTYSLAIWGSSVNYQLMSFAHFSFVLSFSWWVTNIFFRFVFFFFNGIFWWLLMFLRLLFNSFVVCASCFIRNLSMSADWRESPVFFDTSLTFGFYI